MIKEAPGPINFTVFLTMFGEKLKGERAPRELGVVDGHPHHQQHPVPPGEATQLSGPPSPFQAPWRPQMGAAKGKAGGTDCHTVVYRAHKVGQSKDSTHTTAKR